MNEEAIVSIESRDYWFKIVDFLQQNWALIDADASGATVWFFGDTSGVFDQVRFPSANAAHRALARNGFRRYTEDTQSHSFIAAPKPPFRRRPHPNGPIYSSGKFWISEDNWLQRYIAESVSRNLCTKILCTTCGATEFRQGLLAALATSSGQETVRRMGPGHAIAMAKALRQVEAVSRDWKWEDAVQFVLYECWYAFRDEAGREAFEAILAGSWAGDVLARMKAHHQARMEAARRRQEANDPENVKARREQKKQLRQQQHAERLAAKAERDRAWREQHQEGES
jgi:hypothetical protein